MAFKKTLNTSSQSNQGLTIIQADRRTGMGNHGIAAWWQSWVVARMRRDSYVKCLQLCGHSCTTSATAQDPREDKGSACVFIRRDAVGAPQGRLSAIRPRFFLKLKTAAVLRSEAK